MAIRTWVGVFCQDQLLSGKLHRIEIKLHNIDPFVPRKRKKSIGRTNGVIPVLKRPKNPKQQKKKLRFGPSNAIEQPVETLRLRIIDGNPYWSGCFLPGPAFVWEIAQNRNKIAHHWPIYTGKLHRIVRPT